MIRPQSADLVFTLLVRQERPPFIPEGALTRRRAMEVDTPKRKLVRLGVWGQDSRVPGIKPLFSIALRGIIA